MKIVTASADRPWMDAFHTTFANRCLPMRIANQDGWFLLNPSAIEVTWNGGIKQADVVVKDLEGQATPAISHFGHGLLTWWIPYLFRAPQGYNVSIRGPVNYCKDGIVPLNATVEADWSVASFPMTWKITRVGHPVRFEKDEPICMISPVRRGETELFTPEVRKIQSNPQLLSDFEGWSKSRHAHNESLRYPKPPTKWQKHYFVGTHPNSGEVFADHQVRLIVKPFPEFEPAPEPQAPQSSPAHASACPWPGHTAVPGEQAHAKADTISQMHAAHCAEPHFFEGLAELQLYVRRWLAHEQTCTGLGEPAWRYEFSPDTFCFLSAKPELVFPKDLLESLTERLAIWAAEKRFGKLASLQLSLFVNGCRRAPSHLREGTYFVLPLSQRACSVLRGGRVLIESVASPSSKTRPTGKTKRILETLQSNTLLSFGCGYRVGVEELRGSMAPGEGLLLLEGSFQ